jgi:hypothetical protein
VESLALWRRHDLVALDKEPDETNAWTAHQRQRIDALLLVGATSPSADMEEMHHAIDEISAQVRERMAHLADHKIRACVHSLNPRKHPAWVPLHVRANCVACRRGLPSRAERCSAWTIPSLVWSRSSLTPAHRLGLFAWYACPHHQSHLNSSSDYHEFVYVDRNTRSRLRPT